MKNLSLRTVILLTLGILSWGTIGYHYIEGWGFFDSLYMTIITISTVGFREISDMSEAGRLWTILLILLGVTLGTFIVSRFTEQITDTIRYRRRKMLRRISKLSDHYIICGFGRIGQVIADELRKSGRRFVIIEKDGAVLQALDPEECLYIESNAVNEEVLIKANIAQARGLVSVINSDAENVFLTMMARELNPELYIVARSVDPATTQRIKKAGANSVMNPYSLSGYRMAQLLINPKVNEFVDMLRQDSHLDMTIEEVIVPVGSPFQGHSIAELNFRRNYHILITGITRSSGELIFNPAPELPIEAGDSLIAIGKKDDIHRLKTDAAAAGGKH